MKIIKMKSDYFLIEFNTDELVLINNALNEVCNAIDVPEFQTRLGSSPEEADSLLKEIGAVLKEKLS